MKKLINFLLLSIAIFTVFSITAIVRAQKENEIATSTAQKTIDYYLPYPGILPGHTLYPLKMLRDKVISLFIVDPLKKAEFFLLMADKRINAGKFLIDYRKIDLGEPTISKGQNYLDQTLQIATDLKKQGKEIQSFSERLEKATSKHLEVLEEVLLKVPESAKPGIRNAIERSQKSQEKIKELMEKKKKK